QATTAASAGTPELLTPYEASGLTRYTTHPEMVEYLRAVQGASAEMVLERYGTTMEGRELLFALFSRPGVATPAEAHASGRPIVLLGANVHGFNYLLRESLLVMIRELATPGTELNALLDHIIVLVVPSKNPDALTLDSRFNPIGADLNRDYMTLDQPSMAAFVGEVLNRWHPHLVVDGHDGGAVQYGGAYPYNLLYQGPAIAGADPALTELVDRAVFPHLNRRLEAEGYRAFYWARTDGERWIGGGSAPRMGRNYGGLANKVTILFEMEVWHDAEAAMGTGMTALEAVLEYAATEADELLAVVDAARRSTVELGEGAEGTIPVRATVEAEPFRVEFQTRDPDDPDGLITVRDAELVKRPVGTAFRDRPWAYVLPPEAREAVALLLRHNIEVERLTESVEREGSRYTLASVEWEEAVNGQRAAPVLEVGREIHGMVELPRGAWVVRTGQLLGRVASQLLEPEAEDNLFYWGRMTSLLPLPALSAGDATDEEALIPLVRLMAPTGLPTQRVGGR
ncbi:MAG: hypothetical protein EA422_11455, partial [Gemmatimonadales bacterium]